MMFHFLFAGILLLGILYGISHFILFCQGKTMTFDGRVIKRGEGADSADFEPLIRSIPNPVPHSEAGL